VLLYGFKNVFNSNGTTLSVVMIVDSMLLIRGDSGYAYELQKKDSSEIFGEFTFHRHSFLRKRKRFYKKNIQEILASVNRCSSDD